MDLSVTMPLLQLKISLLLCKEGECKEGDSVMYAIILICSKDLDVSSQVRP